MGAVYRAWDTRLKKPVALKEMVAQPGLDPKTLIQLRQQFEQEAVTMARLKHNHLVGVTDFFEERGNAYLVMEFVEGESLRKHIEREGSLPEGRVLTWAEQLLDALEYCHSQGIIHRDISPQNVIIRPDGWAVLVDFGLVKLWDPRDPRTRTAMQGVGKPEYAPPEQYDAQSGHTDVRSDVYSLGATLYHALTGKAPPTVTQRIVDSDALPALRKLKPQIGAGLAGAIMRSLELAPSARFSTAAEMKRALGFEAPEVTHQKTLPERAQTRRMPDSHFKPPDAQILIAQAKASAAEGNYDAALDACDHALRISPNEREALEARSNVWTQKGDAALQRDDLEAALAAYREVGDEGKIAEVKAFRKQREIARVEAQAHALERAGRWTEAAEAYERLTMDYPDEEGQAEWTAALRRCQEEEHLAQLFEKGRNALKQEDWKAAQDALTDLVNQRLRYERDGVRATRLLDRAAVEGRTQSPTWQGIPLWAWTTAAVIVAVVITAVVLTSTPQPFGSLHFVSDRSGKREVYRLTRAAETVRVTHTPGTGESWGPVRATGESLHFVSDRNGKREIYRLTQGAETVQVTHTPGDAESWAPAIGPGGTLVFVSDRDGRREVYRLTRQSEVVRVTHTTDDGGSWLSPR
jgi:serine/threonine-protein kinase